jgi:hypothetical protein
MEVDWSEVQGRHAPSSAPGTIEDSPMPDALLLATSLLTIVAGLLLQRPEASPRRRSRTR